MGSCGTANGYYQHRRRGETACAPCKQAHAHEVNTRRRIKKGLPTWPMT